MNNKILKTAILLPICLLSVAPSYAATITYENVSAAGGYDAPVLIKELEFEGAFWDVSINWNTSYNNTYATAPKFFGNASGAQSATNAIRQALLNDTPPYPGTGLDGSYLITPYSATASSGVWGTDMHAGGVAINASTTYPRSGFTTWTVSEPTADLLLDFGLISILSAINEREKE